MVGADVEPTHIVPDDEKMLGLSAPEVTLRMPQS